jgi:hypothetical protein
MGPDDMRRGERGYNGRGVLAFLILKGKAEGVEGFSRKIIFESTPA